MSHIYPEQSSDVHIAFLLADRAGGGMCFNRAASIYRPGNTARG